MKIDSSTIFLESRHASVEQHTVQESLRQWQGNQRPDFEGNNARGTRQAVPSAIVELSNAGKTAQSAETEAIADQAEEIENDPKMQLIMRMIEALTGKKIRLFESADLQLDDTAQHAPEKTNRASETAQQQRVGWGLEYDYRETHFEAERTSVAAQGVVKTADGREISFALQLDMSREFYQETNISLRAGDGVRKDPLVINFNGSAAQLTDTSFAFDIDSDGTQEQISFVGPNSGFLALDLNGDGIINNGSELFGAQSGDGFADLARHDADGNLWIDENDAVYADLRIWTRDAAGNDQLLTLAEKQVGALYLGNVSSQFSLNNADNETLGEIRSTGIYLAENGSAGTLQQIDLIV